MAAGQGRPQLRNKYAVVFGYISGKGLKVVRTAGKLHRIDNLSTGEFTLLYVEDAMKVIPPNEVTKLERLAGFEIPLYTNREKARYTTPPTSGGDKGENSLGFRVLMEVELPGADDE